MPHVRAPAPIVLCSLAVLLALGPAGRAMAQAAPPAPVSSSAASTAGTTASPAAVPTTAPAASSTPAATDPKAAASHSATAHVSEFRALRLSRLVGMPVRTAQGEPVGSVHDVIVNAANGRVRYALVSLGGKDAGGARLAPVPVGEFRMSSQRDALLLAARARPRLDPLAFAASAWSDAWLREPGRLAQLDRAWGLPARTGSAIAVRRGSTLLRRAVSTPGGEPLGQLEEVVVHLNQQRVNYAVLRLTSAAGGGGDKHVAVPMMRLRSGPAEGAALVLEVDARQLAAMPALDYAQQQNPNDRAFTAEIGRQLSRFAGVGGAGPGAARTAPQAN
ncbi:PRC-barrel domain-containing protein [Ramlibacter sp. AN1015]|uniref:PRC-barrel domain-containing protein n=1 Tax=Ramlibacter sp. AN1015 TaxID=3133428 RepID=UPI0030C3EBC9